MDTGTILYAEDAEKALLGSLLTDPLAIAPMSALIRAEDFYLDQHKALWDVLVKLGEGADLLTVEAALESAGKLATVGGVAYLAELTTVPITALNVRHYAEVVRSKALRRRIIDSAQAMLVASYGNKDDDQLIKLAQNKLTAAIRHHAQGKAMSKADAIQKWRDDLDALLDNRKLRGVPTGIRELDYKLGGLKGGKLYIIAGLPGSGKTTLMLNLLVNAAYQRAPGAMFSGEMTEPELASICISIIAARRYDGVNQSEGHIIKLDDRKRDDLIAALRWAAVELEALPIELRCYPGITPAQFRYECAALKAERDIQIAAADYIQIMQSGLSGREANREREIAHIAEELKRIALDDDMRIAILAGSQLTDGGLLRESRAIGHHADVVISLKADGQGQSLTAEINKNRDGATGSVELAFKREASSIRGVGV